MQVRHDEEVRGGDVGTARCVRAAAGAAAWQSSNVDDGAMHAARVGGGASIGIPDATHEKAGDVYRFFCTKAPPFYRGSELRIKDPQNTTYKIQL